MRFWIEASVPNLCSTGVRTQGAATYAFMIFAGERCRGPLKLHRTSSSHRGRVRLLES